MKVLAFGIPVVVSMASCVHSFVCSPLQPQNPSSHVYRELPPGFPSTMAMPHTSTANLGHNMADWSNQKTPPTSRMATHHPDPFKDSLNPFDQGLFLQSSSRSSKLDGPVSASMTSSPMPTLFTEKERGIIDGPPHPGSASMAHQPPHTADEDVSFGAQLSGLTSHPHTRTSGLGHDPVSQRSLLSRQRRVHRETSQEATPGASILLDARDSTSESFWSGEVNTLDRAVTTTDTTTAVSEMKRQFLRWVDNSRAFQGLAQIRHHESQTTGSLGHVRITDPSWMLGQSLGRHERYLVQTSYLLSQPRTAIAF